MKEIRCEMAGIVAEVIVKEGDSVNEGQTLITIESMKMIMPITATQSGKVTKVNVNSGEFLNEGDTILLLE